MKLLRAVLMLLAALAAGPQALAQPWPARTVAVVAKNDVPASDLKGFIAWLKANPDKASEGTAGAGSPQHEVIVRLNGAMSAALADPALRAKLADLGQEIFPREQQTPEALAALHRAEIEKIDSKIKERGFTLVPLALYFKDGRAKVEIGLARGKKSYDKRQAIAERTAKREAEVAIGRRAKGMS